MKQSVSERLGKILDMVYEQGVKDSGYSDETTLEVDDAKKAILELMREIVPAQKQTDLDPDSEGFCNFEWNACRAEILKRLGG